MYLSGSPLFITNSLFFACSVTTSANDQWGNAIYSIDGNSNNFDLSSFLRCGERKDKSGDSCSYLYNAVHVVKRMNCSNNYGNGGGSTCAFWKSQKDSIMKYIQCENAQDNYAFEVIYTDMNM